MVERRLRFDLGCYSADAVQRAIYRLSDRLSGQVSVEGDTVSCLVHLTAHDPGETEQVLADFQNEVLDQALRERIRDETSEVRNLILALAFSDSGLLGADEPSE